jgi:O-antigen/teichoic acid export membrane protein
MSSRSRSTSLLAVGSVASGVAAYLFFSLTTHALGATAAAPVAVLWAWWSFSSAALTFPVQHWAIRALAADGDERRVRATTPRLLVAAVVLACLSTLVAWLLREPLFAGHSGVFPLLMGLVVLGSVGNGLVRGLLTGRHRIGAVGASLVAENTLRCLYAVVLLAAGVTDPAAYGWSLIGGYLVLAFWPGALRASAAGGALPEAEPLLRFLGPASGGQLLAQGVLTGGPVLLALAGGSPAEVTTLFAALALFRAPYTLGTSMVALLTGRFTRWLVAGRHDLVRRAGWQLVGATAVAVPAAAVLAWTIGPALLRIVFGDDIDLSRGLTTLVAIGSALALAGLVATTTLLAAGRAAHLVAFWVAAVVVGSAWWVAVQPGALDGAVGWFVVVETVAAALLLTTAVRTARAVTD